MQPQQQQHNHNHNHRQQQLQSPAAYFGTNQTEAVHTLHQQDLCKLHQQTLPSGIHQQPLIQHQDLVSISLQCSSASQSDTSQRRRRLQQAEAMYQTAGQQWNSPMQSINHTQDLKEAVVQRISLSAQGVSANAVPPPLGSGYCDNSGLPTGAVFPSQVGVTWPEVGGQNLPSPLDGQSRRNSATALVPSGADLEAAAEAVPPEGTPNSGTLESHHHDPSAASDNEKPFQFTSARPPVAASRSFQGPEGIWLQPMLPEKKELLNEQIRRRQQAILSAKERLAEGRGTMQVLEALSRSRRNTDAGGHGTAGAAKRAAITRQGLRFRSFDGSRDLSAESLAELIAKGMAQGATAEEVVEQACSFYAQEAPVLEKINTRGNSFGFP